MRRAERRIDVTAAIGFGSGHETAVTVCLPEPDLLPPDPVVVFCWPGGGYSRQYFDLRIPGLAGYSQAEHHAARGVVTVICDHLGVGDSSEPDRSLLSYETVADANRVTVAAVVGLMAEGAIDPAYPPIQPATLIGLGQSYGGMLLVVQQARRRTFDGIGILGFSGFGVQMPQPSPSGTTTEGGTPTGGAAGPMFDRELMTYALHWEDVPEQILAEDMKGEHPARLDPVPAWASPRRPGGRHWAPSNPGVISDWAAVVECPVFVGLGERDLSPDPHREPAAFGRSTDVTLAVVPRMAHMHNFAGTREVLWDRLLHWMQGVARVRGGRPQEIRKPT